MITRENCDFKKLDCYLDSCAKEGCTIARGRAKEKERTERNERAQQDPAYVLAHWKEMVRDSAITDTGKPLCMPVIDGSALDKGFYVYVVLKQQVPVWIGYCMGRGRKCAILATQQRVEGTSALILACGLSQRQAKQMVQTLKRRLEKSE